MTKEQAIRTLKRHNLWPRNECVHLGRAFEAVALCYEVVSNADMFWEELLEEELGLAHGHISSGAAYFPNKAASHRAVETLAQLELRSFGHLEACEECGRVTPEAKGAFESAAAERYKENEGEYRLCVCEVEALPWES